MLHDANFPNSTGVLIGNKLHRAPPNTSHPHWAEICHLACKASSGRTSKVPKAIFGAIGVFDFKKRQGTSGLLHQLSDSVSGSSHGLKKFGGLIVVDFAS